MGSCDVFEPLHFRNSDAGLSATQSDLPRALRIHFTHGMPPPVITLGEPVLGGGAGAVVVWSPAAKALTTSPAPAAWEPAAGVPLEAPEASVEVEKSVPRTTLR